MKKHVAIFILIDGLGWDYVKDRSFLAPFAKSSGPARTVLGFSASAIPTLLSGKLPSESGHGNLFYYDPEGSIFRWTKPFRWLPINLINRIPLVRGLFSQFLSRETKRRCGYTGYFNIYSAPLKYRYLFGYNETKSVFLEGLRSGQTIFEVLSQNNVPFVLSTYPRSDIDSLAVIRSALQNGEAPFCFAYLTELDGYLHQHCHDQSLVQDRISWYEEKLLDLYKVARENFESTDIYVFSDHGMTPTRGTFDLISSIGQLPHNMPQDYVAFYDSTMARFWFFSDKARKEITTLLERHDCGSILSDDELKKEGVYFEDCKFGELVFVMNPGIVIEPSFMGEKAPRGMHGFHPGDHWSDAMFVSSNPNALPQHIRDFFVVMQKEIKIIKSEVQ